MKTIVSFDNGIKNPIVLIVQKVQLLPIILNFQNRFC